MEEMIDCLKRCAEQSAFVSDRFGRIGWQDYRSLYLSRGWDNVNWVIAASAMLDIDDRCVAELAAELEPVLANHRHRETGRIGNGLYQLLGGASGSAHPSVDEFAKTLICGAVKVGAERVAELLLDWVRGGPLRYRLNILLQGVEIDGPLRLPEGVELWSLPRSSGELPASLPFSMLTEKVSVVDFMGGAVVSFDCELEPALYRPDDNEVSESLPRNGNLLLASGRIPNFHESYFCESLSLACDGFIDWFLVWRDVGDLEAFGGARNWDSYRPPRHAPKTKVEQSDLEQALKIHNARYARGEPREHIELALRRWIKSKQSGTDEDKLIELRIALEALYEVKQRTGKGIAVAGRGAEHLAECQERWQEIWDTLKRAYDDASGAVHGEELVHAVDDPGLISSAQGICRGGILKRLDESERPNWEDMIFRHQGVKRASEAKSDASA
ncbi:MAG: hypothetical protein OXF89_07085 [Rhodospirillaceae bacterium]|nr:hypothetical protein [Rhodospirillaceae bacterium]